MKLIIFLLASLFIFTGLIGFINSPNDLNINIKHNPYPVNVNNSVSYVREFPINLNNVPSGTGYYQQLITIGNASYPYSNYNINSQGSNIQFISQNNSYLYAWLQNINTTTISVWVKNFNSSNTINMQVFPEFENLFSANGYLGEAPQLSSNYAEYDNGIHVFTAYFNGLTPLSDFIQYYPADTSITQTVQSFNGVNTYTINDSRNNSFSGSVLIPEFALNVSIPNGNLIVQSSTYLAETSTADNPRIALLNSMSDLSTLDAIGVNSGWAGAYFQEQNISNGNGNYDINQYGTEAIGWQYGEINYTAGSSTYLGTLSPNPNSLSGGHSAIANNSITKGGNLYIGAIGGINAVYTILQNSMFFNYVFAASLGSVSSMPTFTIGTSLYHSIDFKLIGSSISINWGIFINGTFYNANSSNIYLNMTNGYYNIIVNLPSQYTAISNDVLRVNNTNQIFKIVVASQNNNSNFSSDIMYAIILASIIIAVALYFSRRN